MRIKRILVPVDFSASSRKAVDYAVDFAREHKAELLLVHIIEPMNYAVPRFLPEPTALLEEQRKAAAQQLLHLESAIKKRYRDCASEIHFGVVFQTIIELANSLKADLIIIATHGRTGLSHILMGSVAEKIVRHSHCPVLTIRTVAPPAVPGRVRRARRVRRKSVAQ